jgi:hypothetical protein
MYPDGYDGFTHFCTRPRDESYPEGCSHTESLTIDLSKMVRTRYGRLSQDAIRHLAKARNPAIKVTHEEVDTYQKELGFDGKTIDFDGFRFVLQTPSLAAYLEAGQVFNTEILNEVQANNTKAIYEAIAYRRLRSFIPYIARLESIGTDDEVLMTIDDSLGISMILDALTNTPGYEENLEQKFIDFIAESQLTHICYPAFACKACGHQPETSNGFLSLDPQTAFFTMAYRKLIPVS